MINKKFHELCDRHKIHHTELVKARLTHKAARLRNEMAHELLNENYSFREIADLFGLTEYWVRSLKRRPIHSIKTKASEKAEETAQAVMQYWHDRGYMHVEVWTVFRVVKINGVNRQYWAVESNLVNGLPPSEDT